MRPLTPRQQQIWNNEILTPEKCAVYRKDWEAEARTKTSPCVHLGSEIRREECPTCCGKTRIKVFSCDVHRECCFSNSLQTVKGCGACDDYVGRAV